jgi:hypothetical protein
LLPDGVETEEKRTPVEGTCFSPSNGNSTFSAGGVQQMLLIDELCVSGQGGVRESRGKADGKAGKRVEPTASGEGGSCRYVSR